MDRSWRTGQGLRESPKPDSLHPGLYGKVCVRGLSCVSGAVHPPTTCPNVELCVICEIPFSGLFVFSDTVPF